MTQKQIQTIQIDQVIGDMRGYHFENFLEASVIYIIFDRDFQRYRILSRFINIFKLKVKRNFPTFVLGIFL